ncbi:FAD-binding domain-containing protein [Altererythrobacter lutimaris]|uniref:DNA photolyase n=1 Tax=Altererythrobacter lutimaris TaxID=2743979 RepID=A0A850HCK0_9SPHN|nr:FAD-binding domain-containing protein [Altererythrobacter lutimaris]NVE95933.1 DNA photolyase [Altererythrobacter lutimaris]
MTWTPDRTTALARLQAFLPRAGRHYANVRNHDNGPERSNVSQLSPWLHAGLISETEMLERVLAEHSPSAADKFVSEVFWRIYFKGYLEQRPSIWRSYCDSRDAALADIESNSGLSKAYAEACEGRTGIAAFDHWARELTETGYLHNHARMWFASIWIFTLKLDWTLGADFFLRHLIDGDAASNTLSWRWVGGLHTKGKTYLARAGNIAQYTENHPDGPLEAKGLASEAPPLEEPQEHARQKLDLPTTPVSLEQPYALLLHDEAAHHVPLDLPQAPVLVIGAARPEARSPLPTSDAARDFAHGAVRSGLADAGEAFRCPTAEWSSEGELAALLDQYGISHLITPYLPTGWTRDALWPELETLSGRGELTLLLPQVQRVTWPHAKAGFFGVKKQIEGVIREAGLAA